MMITENEKAKVQERLSRHAGKIVTRNPDVFDEVLLECPAFGYYVSAVRRSESFGVLGTEYIYDVTYNCTDVSEDDVYLEDSEDDCISLFHAYVGNHKPVVAVCSLCRETALSALSRFQVEYGGFYPALKDYKCTAMYSSINGYWYATVYFEYHIAASKLDSLEKKLQKKILSLYPVISNYRLPKVAKAYIVHNYLAKTITYTLNPGIKEEELVYQQSAYGALLRQKCVCQGYAEAYKRILNGQGIFCNCLTGKIMGSNEYHAWNIIGFNPGEYFHVDVTWDSLGDGMCSNKYFGKSDAFFSTSRLWTRNPAWICRCERDIVAEAREHINRFLSMGDLRGIDTRYLDV